MNDQNPATQEPVIAVGAGPAGCTVSLLLADFGIPVTLLERHAQPHPLPRAVHLDDEVARTLDRIGVSEGFLARSRPGGGLRLLDASHRVMAEFSRDHQASQHGFPQANMFHQPDLEELLFARVERHPLITFHRGAEVTVIDGAADPVTADLTGPTGPTGPGRVHARIAGETHTFTGRAVLGCDGANSTIRELAGITMEDLGFTERWLVVDIRAVDGLDTWDGVEQVCDPARAATFMQVTGDRYRWEFRLHDGEDEAGLITPAALSRLLQPWTGRDDLDGLQIIRSATYTFRAQMASRFRSGRTFLLGDAAHLTPPFIGQGLATGRSQVAAIGVAQEAQRVFIARKRDTDPSRCPQFSFDKNDRRVTVYYFYLWDASFGPAFIKVCTYCPWPVKIWVNGHEWAKQQRGGVQHRGVDAAERHRVLAPHPQAGQRVGDLRHRARQLGVGPGQAAGVIGRVGDPLRGDAVRPGGGRVQQQLIGRGRPRQYCYFSRDHGVFPIIVLCWVPRSSCPSGEAIVAVMTSPSRR